MYSPMSGILDPMQYAIALAENAHANGVQFFFQHEVTKIVRTGDLYEISVNQGHAKSSSYSQVDDLSERTFKTRFVVNSAGMYATRISDMLGITGYLTRGFKGEYYVLDKKAGTSLRMPVYPAPNGKGGFATHATITVDGNVLVGPDSYITDGYEDYATTREHLAGLVRDGNKMFENVRSEYYIRTFAGIRWKRVDPETGDVLDFVLERRDEAPYAINLVGIESPGLTCALPLARRVVAKIMEVETFKPNPSFNPERVGIKRFSELSESEAVELIAKRPEYGEIICRCENVTKGEILDAIHNSLGVHTVNSIKIRTRAMMGRCQGGYCETRITALIREELKIPVSDILLCRNGSYLFTGKVREEIE